MNIGDIARITDNSTYNVLPEGKIIDRDTFCNLLTHYIIGSYQFRQVRYKKQLINMNVFFFYDLKIGVAAGYGFSIKHKEFRGLFMKVGSEKQWKDFEDTFNADQY